MDDKNNSSDDIIHVLNNNNGVSINSDDLDSSGIPSNFNKLGSFYLNRSDLGRYTSN